MSEGERKKGRESNARVERASRATGERERARVSVRERVREPKGVCVCACVGEIERSVRESE